MKADVQPCLIGMKCKIVQYESKKWSITV